MSPPSFTEFETLEGAIKERCRGRRWAWGTRTSRGRRPGTLLAVRVVLRGTKSAREIPRGPPSKWISHAPQYSLTSSTSKSTSHPSKITFRRKVTVEQWVQRWLQRQLVDLAPGQPQLCVAQLGWSGWKKFAYLCNYLYFYLSLYQ